MAQINSNDTLRCDKDGYFDLDCLKPYSSVWVSTCRRDTRGKRDIFDDENESKKLVTSSRACNNLNSLLDNSENESSPNSSDATLSQKFSTNCNSQSEFSNMSSSNFDLKKFEKESSTKCIKNLSEQFLESVCMLGGSSSVNESEDSDLLSQHAKLEKGQSVESIKVLPEIVKSIEKIIPEDVFMKEKCKSELIEEDKNKEEETLKNNTYKKSNVQKRVEDAGNIKSSLNSSSPMPNPCSMYKNHVEHFGESKTFKLLSDNGKLVSELDITSLKLKDQCGREFPITVKYVWETDSSELMNAAGNIVSTSQAFIKLIDSVSTIGLKSDNELSNCNTLTDLNGMENEQNQITSDLKEFKDKEFTFAESKPMKLYRQEETDNHANEMMADRKGRLFHVKYQQNKQISSQIQGLKEIHKYPVEARKDRFGLAASDGRSVNDSRCDLTSMMLRKKTSNDMKNYPINSTRPSTYNKCFAKKKEIENNERIMRPPTAPLRKNSVKSGIKASTKSLKDDSFKAMISTSGKKIGNKFHNTTTINSKNIWK